MAKKRLTQQQEFEIMKLVLDKFLWIGFAIMLFGLYNLAYVAIPIGITWLIVGAIILLILMILIVREYEIIK